MKESFILYTDQKAVVDKLTDEQAGKLLKAIYEYTSTHKMPELDNLLDLVITPIKTAIDKNNEKYEEIRKKRAEAGSKGGKQRVANQANACTCNQVEANQADNVSVYDNSSNNSNSTNIINLLNNNNNNNIYTYFENNIDLLTESSAETLKMYEQELPSDVIIYAMDKAVANKARNLAYIVGILKNWLRAGVKNLQQAKDEEERFRGGKKTGVSPPNCDNQLGDENNPNSWAYFMKKMKEKGET